ncbi:threonylcarbamoyl-AMP synthase [Patescibacteria group bacterium]|nr:threonylcarbamoyl-AMP synthase [Patescibacteria group bacterium]
MKIINVKNGLNTSDLSSIIDVLRNNGTFIFPTETLYGIGCSILNTSAVSKIYNLKNRNEKKAFIVLISKKKDLYPLVSSVNEISEKLIDKYWPGPLSIIFKKSFLISPLISNLDTIAIRQTSCKIISDIIDKLGAPIIAPSANFEGEAPVSDFSKINKDLLNQVDIAIDAGIIKNNLKPSTIIDVSNGNLKILREGAIDIKI